MRGGTGVPRDQQDWTSVFARPQSQAAGSPATWAIGTTTKTFTLAPDTSIVCFLCPTFFNIDALTITGHTSGFTYVAAEPLNTSFAPIYYAVVNSAVDTSVDITVTCTIAVSAFVSSVPDPVAAVSVPTVPAPWQAPNRTPLKMDFGNPGMNNTVTIIPAQTNSRSIYLHSAYWLWNAAPANAFGVFQDSNGTEIGADSLPALLGPRYMDWKGAKMAGGFAFQFKQTSSAAANSFFCQGSITYSVY